jgi:hypothetical protein
MSIPGAVYAVSNARSLGFLNSSNRWTATGLALGYILKVLPTSTGNQSLALRPPEQCLYLRYYVAGAGALLIKFGQWLMRRGTATDEELRTGSVIEQLLIEALDEYLTIAADIRDRTLIRQERDRLSRSRYASITKRHKRYPLITTMERLGLLEAEKAGGSRITMAQDATGRLAALLREIPDITSLERLVRDDSLAAAIGRVLSETKGGVWSQTPQLGSLLADAYRYALDVGLQACPLVYLDDLLLAFDPSSAGKTTAEGIFEPLHRRMPSAIRFHVDRRGRRAFLLLGREASNNLENLPGLPGLTSSS